MGSNRLPPCVDTLPCHNPFLGHWQHESQIRIHQGANLLALSLLTTPGFLLPCPPPPTPPPPPSFLTSALRALPPEAFDVDTIEPDIFVLSNLEGQSIKITGASSNMTWGQISRPHRATASYGDLDIMGVAQSPTIEMKHNVHTTCLEALKHNCNIFRNRDISATVTSYFLASCRPPPPPPPPQAPRARHGQPLSAPPCQRLH